MRVAGVETVRFGDIRLMKLVVCQPYALAAVTPQEIFLVLIFVRGWVDPRALVRTSGIQPATFRLVAQWIKLIGLLVL